MLRLQEIKEHITDYMFRPIKTYSNMKKWLKCSEMIVQMSEINQHKAKNCYTLLGLQKQNKTFCYNTHLRYLGIGLHKHVKQ